MPKFLLSAATFYLTISSLHAGITITATQSGSDVVITTSSGSLNTTDLTFLNPTAQVAKIRRDANNGIWVGPESATPLDFWNGATQPSDFVSIGVTGDAIATSGSGDKIGVFSSFIYTPPNYVSGTSIAAATSIYAGESLASLGLIEGTYIWSWGSNGNEDSITLVVEPVPEPSGSILICCGVLAMLVRRKR